MAGAGWASPGLGAALATAPPQASATAPPQASATASPEASAPAFPEASALAFPETSAATSPKVSAPASPGTSVPARVAGRAGLFGAPVGAWARALAVPEVPSSTPVTAASALRFDRSSRRSPCRIPVDPRCASWYV
ncbi:hypothetical protein CD790_21090 [Streptomyces sp. SAJ15]|nr:hypothetical protein CD790_21090 [Streptomyces sp. SAJ15]